MRSSAFTCHACRTPLAKWVGQCPTCGAWGSVGPGQAVVAVPLSAVSASAGGCVPTGVPELDRVLGGGVVPGSVTLLGGEPGIGKSTLLLQVLSSLAAAGRTCLLICAEESAAQVKLRAARLGEIPEGLLVLAETSLSAILAAIASCRPEFCVVDSIQAVADDGVESAPGSVTQVRQCAYALARVAKETAVSIALVGHVTKDGALAGPRALEHVVDTVLSFEGDRHHSLRMLAAVKHRFGATGELGIFEMTEAGMRGVDDPSGLFLADRRTGVPGSAIVTAMEGRRALVAEIQALVSAAGSGGGRRSAQGVDAGRLSLLLAVLDKRAGLQLTSFEIYVSAVGGLRLTEPAADLPIVLALASAALGRPLPDGLVAFGEIGLAGEIRQVPNGQRRLAEAGRLGFGQALVPASFTGTVEGMAITRVSDVGEAAALLASGELDHLVRLRAIG